MTHLTRTLTIVLSLTATLAVGLGAHAARSAAEPVDVAPGATRLTMESGAIDDGRYRIDTLGTPLAFSSDRGSLRVRYNRGAVVVLSDPFSEGPGDRDIVFARLSTLVDPRSPGASWPAGDFAGWLQSLRDGVTASDPEVAALGGFAGRRIDLVNNGGPTSRIGLGTTGSTSHSLSAGSSYRIWMVEQADEAPLAVIVGVANEQHTGWFDVAEELLSTIELGDVAPNPAPSGGRQPDAPDRGELWAPLPRWPDVSLDES